MQTVIFDIDGTLANCTRRLHHVTGSKRDWPAFFAALSDDPPYDDICRLCDQLAERNRIVFCSGRPEQYRFTTQTWLDRHGLYGAALYMRPDDDTRSDYLVKADLLTAIRADGHAPWLVIDDRPSVVAMWRSQGLTCLQCRDWAEPPSGPPGILTLMIGPSGAGKSTWLTSVCFSSSSDNHRWRIYSAHIVSSDQIRADLCGDWRDQSRNDEVFAALHAVVKTRITHGLPAVVDATNIRRKDRLACAILAPPDAPIRYFVIDRPEADKLRDADWRTPELIARHAQTFRSQLKDILAGDGQPNITVTDLRR